MPVLEGHCCLRLEIPLHFLNLGRYRLELGSSLYQREFIIPPKSEPTVFFEIAGLIYPSPYHSEKRPGPVVLDYPWKLIKQENVCNPDSSNNNLR